MENITQFQLPIIEDLLFFLVFCNNKINIFGFWTIVWMKQLISQWVQKNCDGNTSKVSEILQNKWKMYQLIEKIISRISLMKIIVSFGSNSIHLFSHLSIFLSFIKLRVQSNNRLSRAMQTTSFCHWCVSNFLRNCVCPLYLQGEVPL